MSVEQKPGNFEVQKMLHSQVKRLNKLCNKRCKFLNESAVLNRAEENCMDRCVIKFYKSRNLLNEMSQEGLLK